MKAWLDSYFGISERNSTIKKEVLGGCLTFFTISYILAVNPAILADAGMNPNAVLMATCIASFIGCMIMGVFAKLPLALSAGMGINAFFAYTVVNTMGYSWQIALLAVFIEGVIFVILSLTNVRERIFNGIPMCLKYGIPIGIGLFIVFIGLQKSGLCVDNSATLVSMVEFKENFHQSGICAVLTIVGLISLFVLDFMKKQGFILLSLFVLWGIGIVLELAGVYIPDADKGFYTLIPKYEFGSIQDEFSTFGAAFTTDLNFNNIFNLVVVIITLLFVDLFDTIGTLIAAGMQANLLDENGRLPNIKKALMADAVATCVGAACGTSTITTYSESVVGISVGAKTGLTSVTVGFLFLLAIPFGPLFVCIPTFATAPILIYVGFLMFKGLIGLQAKLDFRETVSLFLCVVTIPLFYSISDGIALGIIFYTFLGLFASKKMSQNLFLWILTIMFILKYVFL